MENMKNIPASNMKFFPTGVGGGVKSWNDSDLRCLGVFTKEKEI